jgi:hypothetical protein
MASFKQRTFNAADYRTKAATNRRDAALNEFYAALETGRPEEIRIAHNEAVDTYELMLFAMEDREKVLFQVNDQDPNTRHIP